MIMNSYSNSDASKQTFSHVTVFNHDSRSRYFLSNVAYVLKIRVYKFVVFFSKSNIFVI